MDMSDIIRSPSRDPLQSTRAHTHRVEGPGTLVDVDPHEEGIQPPSEPVPLRQPLSKAAPPLIPCSSSETIDTHTSLPCHLNRPIIWTHHDIGLPSTKMRWSPNLKSNFLMASTSQYFYCVYLSHESLFPSAWLSCACPTCGSKHVHNCMDGVEKRDINHKDAQEKDPGKVKDTVFVLSLIQSQTLVPCKLSEAALPFLSLPLGPLKSPPPATCNNMYSCKQRLHL